MANLVAMGAPIHKCARAPARVPDTKWNPDDVVGCYLDGQCCVASRPWIMAGCPRKFFEPSVHNQGSSYAQSMNRFSRCPMDIALCVKIKGGKIVAHNDPCVVCVQLHPHRLH